MPDNFDKRDINREKNNLKFKLLFIPSESERLGKGQYVIEGLNKTTKELLIRLGRSLNLEGNRLIFPIIGQRDKQSTEKLAKKTLQKLTDDSYRLNVLEPFMAEREKLIKELFEDIYR